MGKTGVNPSYGSLVSFSFRSGVYPVILAHSFLFTTIDVSSSSVEQPLIETWTLSFQLSIANEHTAAVQTDRVEIRPWFVRLLPCRFVRPADIS